MAGIDHSIYFQQRPIDILGGVTQGMQLRDQFDQRKMRQAEQQRQQQMREAYAKGITSNPDGSVSYNPQNAMQALAGGGFGQEAFQLGQQQHQQGIADQQRDFDNRMKQGQFDQSQQKSQWDREYQQAQMGKLREETNQLRMKPTQQKEIKQNQALAAGFGRRIEQAESAMNSLRDAGYDPTSITAGIGRSLPNIARSKEAQMQEQAERNFINAVLRRESGAAIAPHEFENAELQYFPKVGDSPEVLAQKSANRAQAMGMFKAEAGHAWDAIPLESPNRNPLKQRPTDPPIGKTQGGYKYLGGDPSDQRNWEKI